ncbi:SdiA-regulated domain-containing protein [Luteimonas aquatica]|uniref:SdiA-regulated domain-containing protein n=1 Tax=Luteimonas aquatica TaxID=450364 RepID=UPI001F5A2B5C|nr:SdiA-regulated domain-containing protein [Luteimonas aquatica]
MLRWLSVLVLVVLLLWALFVAVRFYHVDNRMQRWWMSWHPDSAWNQPRWRGRSLWLPGYRFDIEGREIPGIEDNLSGLDFDHARGELVGVINRPGEVVVLDTEGRLLRRHRLVGASDVEALAWLGESRIALLQEGRRSVAVAALPARDGEPIRIDPARVYALAPGERDNSGPEGMAYDAATDTLYVTKEHSPVALHAIRGLRGGGPLATTDLSGWLKRMPFATDFSSIEFDPRHRHLLLLSDESQMLMEIGPHGEPVSWRSLDASRLDRLPAPQPEGVTLDDQGTIYVVSEPNLFYRLRRVRD